ncbi:TPA: protein translocase SEC61 complex subunit gamma [Candidatus Woesearchaeota archaeon]|nr:protein translocase SEC61 complex subunit gamma [Candidatus Woesearchaeota archaeon]
MIIAKLRTFVGECRRVLTVTKKPTKQELTSIVKVSAVGIALIGLIGFVLHTAKTMMFQ